jgi:hypothetical protein
MGGCEGDGGCAVSAVRKLFCPVNFFLIFLDFFQQIQTRHQNFAFYDTHIEFFLGGGFFLHTLNWQFLLTLKTKSDETAQKNEKCIL